MKMYLNITPPASVCLFGVGFSFFCWFVLHTSSPFLQHHRSVTLLQHSLLAELKHGVHKESLFAEQEVFVVFVLSKLS